MGAVKERWVRLSIAEKNGCLVATVRQLSKRTGRVYGSIYFRKSEPIDAPGWIAILQAAMRAGEPREMIWDYLRDHGYGD